MSTIADMQDQIKQARVVRDRIIADAEATIADTHKRFASMLEAIKDQVAIDENDQPKRLHRADRIASAAGFTRPYLHTYIQKHLHPKPKKGDEKA